MIGSDKMPRTGASPALDEWMEDGIQRWTPVVDPERFGEHDYGDGNTNDCAYGCGCWMGGYRSGGPVYPHGRCPMNPLPLSAGGKVRCEADIALARIKLERLYSDHVV